MPDIDSLKESKNYHLDIPQKNQAFFVKGSGALDWGMQNRSGAHLQAGIRPHGHAGYRSRLLPGSDLGSRARGREHRALGSLCRRADAHPRRPAQRGPLLLRQGRRAAGQRRPQRAQGALQRAAGHGHRGRPAAQRGRRGRAGVHRGRVRDPVHPQPHPPGGHGQPVRHARAGRDRRGQGA